MVSGCDSDVRPAAHSPRSSPNVSPSHSYSATSVGSMGSSSSSATNGFVSNGTCIDNGFEADNMPMEVEDFEESPNHGVLNGTAKTDESDHSPSRGNFSDFTGICHVWERAGQWESDHILFVSTGIKEKIKDILRLSKISLNTGTCVRPGGMHKIKFSTFSAQSSLFQKVAF